MIKALGISTVVLFLVSGALLSEFLDLKQEIGRVEERCETRISAIATEHQKALREQERAIREEEALAKTELQRALDEERVRRIERMQESDRAQARLRERIEELDSEEEIEWLEMEIPESVLALGAPPE